MADYRFLYLKSHSLSTIIGRQKEIKQLDRLTKSSKSEFLAVYGRRRVGKTFLIREYFNYTFDFQLTGLANANMLQQLTNFQVGLQRQAGFEIMETPENWFSAFQLLIDYLESIDAPRQKVIFLDELPWMDTPRSDFLMSLEHFWNTWATNRKDILLITCGSAAAWMINELINNHGGLHNRVTERMKVYPFNLQETELMLKAQDSVLDRYQILQLYMVMGGIPFYLDQIDPYKSAAQNIEALCFRKGALLVLEFQNLFNSLFKNAAPYERIIIALASKSSGMNRKEISQAAAIPSGGNLSKKLDALEESGFVTRYTPFQKKAKETVYRLSDFYSRFYLKFIRDNTNFDAGIWTNAIDHPAQRAWSGYAFEQVCLAHTQQIKNALQIGGIISNTLTWRSKDGIQIDLLIDRRDQVVNLCEIKYSINPYAITKDYAAKLRNKIGTFKQETNTRKTVFLTMITTYGLVQNKHASALVQNEVLMDALFE